MKIPSLLITLYLGLIVFNFNFPLDTSKANKQLPLVDQKLEWTLVDSQFSHLPASVHIYKTTSFIDEKPNIAYYLIADLKDKNLIFDTDTSYKRRLTPQGFYEKNQQPIVVVNGTFFDFATNRNLNSIIQHGKLVSYNVHSIPLKGKDTFTYIHTFRSALGINQKRKADIAWLYTDSNARYARAFEENPFVYKDSNSNKIDPSKLKAAKKWKMQTAIGGGPVLIQNGAIRITNNEERMFTGKAIDDKHPRTSMGYTADGKLIILLVQGRFPGIAEGASLTQLATILLNLGCVEALNLDGGGSSCMLVNGKETIHPSDKEGQRPVPGVFLIKRK